MTNMRYCQAELAEFDSMGNPGQQSQDARAISIHEKKKAGNIRDWLTTIGEEQLVPCAEPILRVLSAPTPADQLYV